jgi:hypothetical protein
LLARKVADAVGAPLITPAVEALRTFDHSHLDEPGAERWSAQFLSEAEPLISACLAPTPERPR